MESVAGSRWVGPLLVGVGASLLGGAARLIDGAGFVNFDAMWALVWGHQIAHGHAPTYVAPSAPTPHPLETAVGTLLAPLGAGAETALHVLAFLTLGLVVVLTGLLAMRLFGVAAGMLAGALLFTRATLTFYGPLSYVDIPYAALILGALTLEAGRPRRGVPVLLLLALAGLLRPEAWFLSVGYLLWLRPPVDRQGVLLVLVGLAGPVLWGVWDLVLTGDLVYSATHAHQQTTSLHRPTGLHSLFVQAPRTLGQELRPAGVFAAAAGLLLGLYARQRFLLVWGAGLCLAFALVVLAGTPIDARYLLPLVALGCVAASGAVLATSLRRLVPAPVLISVAAVTAVVLVATAPSQARRLGHLRHALQTLATTRAQARVVVKGGIPCLPLVVETAQMAPLVEVWTQLDVDDIKSVGEAEPASGTYLTGQWLTFEQDRFQTLLAAPPSRARTLREHGAWRLSASC